MRFPQHPAEIRVAKNRGAYHGERIEIDPLLKQVEEEALGRGWSADPLVLPDGHHLPAFYRPSPGADRQVYLSAGIHGDEPAGPMAIQTLLANDQWPSKFNYWLIPCLNPGGFRLNTRENESGIDLNRDYRSRNSPLVKSHIEWLEGKPPLDLGLLLHEDWESNGFYVYELNPDNLPSLSPRIVEAVATVCPIELASQIEGRDSTDGMIRFLGSIPDREDWPEALYLVHHKSRLNFTLEAPSDFVLQVRVKALVAAVDAALDAF